LVGDATNLINSNARRKSNQIRLEKSVARISETYLSIFALFVV
jgi:hypothetical protein